MKTGPLALRFAGCALCLMSTFAWQAVAAVESSINLRLSAGSSWQAKNDIQIPNSDLGTRFSLEEAAGAGPVPAARLEINWFINDKHGVRVLLAPLSYTENVIFDQAVNFVGESFSADETTEASYRFNSWRVGYHYSLLKTDAATFRVGATLKVRDAEIRLVQGDTVSFDDDLGFVPLLYMAGTYRLGDSWTLGADLDGLAGGPGRAIDLGISLQYSFTKRWQIGGEFRVLEGGADTDSVYNFAQFNSAALVISTGF